MTTRPLARQWSSKQNDRQRRLRQETVNRFRYNITAYAAAWIIALLLTAPGMWPLAYMFPLGLVAVFDRHLANDGGWGVFIGC
jgi:hypothetical protein